MPLSLSSLSLTLTAVLCMYMLFSLRYCGYFYIIGGIFLGYPTLMLTILLIAFSCAIHRGSAVENAPTVAVTAAPVAVEMKSATEAAPEALVTADKV